MNGMLAVVLINMASWISTCVVSAVAISTTGNAAWGFLMLIPAIFGYSYEKKG